MIQKILLISGRKSSGKTALANYLIGRKLVDAHTPENPTFTRFNISTTGKLMVPVIREIHGEKKEVLELLDLNQQNPDFHRFASVKIWPYAKNYSMANYLKYTCMELFDLDYDQCFGTDDDKNKPSNVKWKDISFVLPPRTVGRVKDEGRYDDFLSARELLEEFGTSICRRLYPDCWANKCYKSILFEEYPFCVIDDIRFANEIEVFKANRECEILTIRLRRNPYNGHSEAEVSLDNYPLENFDFVLDNSEMELSEKHEKVAEFLISKGWL